MRCLPLFACLLALATSSLAVRAADTPPTTPTDLARQRFQEAAEAYQDGRYAAAASLFEAADRIAPSSSRDPQAQRFHASARFNAASAWEQAGEIARAATAYEAALAFENLDPGRGEQASGRLSQLRRSLARVSIRQPLGALITVDHIQRAPVPMVFYLRPGTYDIAVEHDGTESDTRAEFGAGDEHDVTLDLPESAATEPQLQPGAPSEPPPIPPPPADDGATQKTLGWIGVGASVALSGAAIFFGVRALAERDRFNESDHTDADARGKAADFRLATNVLWGGATLTGATGLVLLLTAPTVEF
jgi:tetratricopeptide (TPR) repeat protein